MLWMVVRKQTEVSRSPSITAEPNADVHEEQRLIAEIRAHIFLRSSTGGLRKGIIMVRPYDAKGISV